VPFPIPAAFIDYSSKAFSHPPTPQIPDRALLFFCLKKEPQLWYLSSDKNEEGGQKST